MHQEGSEKVSVMRSEGVRSAVSSGIPMPQQGQKRFRNFFMPLEFPRRHCYLSIEIVFEKPRNASATSTSTPMVNVVIERIVTAKAPLPRGHYAQATKANGLVFVSGQLPLTGDGDPVLAQGLDAQVRQALANLREVLLAAGSDFDKLLSVQVYVADIENWPRVNALYREFIGNPAPARTVVPCGQLHYGAQLEISAIALCDDARRQDDEAE
ncbi:RidA family protein [Paraburkholderia sp.]|uniref:RidA family protein n=1 Tax=Paraburkholderia sp. TaxID=1926495 RepID=UPI0039E4942B